MTLAYYADRSEKSDDLHQILLKTPPLLTTLGLMMQTLVQFGLWVTDGDVGH